MEARQATDHVNALDLSCSEISRLPRAHAQVDLRSSFSFFSVG